MGRFNGVIRYAQLAQRLFALKGFTDVTSIQPQSQAVFPMWSDLAPENRLPKGERLFTTWFHVNWTPANAGCFTQLVSPVSANSLATITSIQLNGFITAAAAADFFNAWLVRVTVPVQASLGNLTDQRNRPQFPLASQTVLSQGGSTLPATALPTSPSLVIFSSLTVGLPAAAGAIVPIVGDLIASPESGLVIPPGQALQVNAASSGAASTGNLTIQCWGYERAIDSSELGFP